MTVVTNEKSQTERLARTMIAVAASLAPLLLGGVHFSVAIGLFVWLYVASWVCLSRFEKGARQSHAAARLSTPAIALLVAGTFSLLQIMPLPAWLLGILSPQNQHLFEEGAKAANLATSGWRPISLLPAETADRALRFLVLAVAMFGVANLRDRSKTWRVLTGALGVGALASLIIGSAHQLVGTDLFYGFYEAKRQVRISTFVSSNHASSLFGAAALVSLALSARMAQARKQSESVALGAVGIGLFIAMMEADSAGAVLAFVVSGVLFLSAYLSSRLRFRRGLIFGVGVAIAVVAGVFPLLLANSSVTTVFDRTFDSVGTRAELMRATLRGSADFWLTGSGAGSTEHIVPVYTDWTLLQDHGIPTIENELVEWILTLGWPVAALVCGLLVLTLWGPRQNDETSDRRRFFTALYLALAAYVLAIASMHFPFLALGLSLPMLVALEAINRQVHHAHHSDPGTVRFHPGEYPYLHVSHGAAKVLLVALGVCAALAMFGRVHYTLPEIKEALAAEDRIRWTPGDARIYYALAEEARRKGELVTAVELSGRAAAVEPTARLRLYHAFVLGLAGKSSESFQVYEELLKNAYAKSGVVAGASRLLSPAELARLLQNHPPEWTQAANEVGRLRGLQPRADFALEMAGLRPNMAESSRLVVESYWLLKQFDVAELWAQSMVASSLLDEEGNPPGYGLWVETLLKAGKNDEALRTAELASKVVPGDPLVAQTLMRLRSVDPLTASAAEKLRVSRAHAAFCNSGHAGSVRQMCLMTEAWLAEGEGRIEDAEVALQRLTDRFQNPIPLAELNHRHGKCMAVRQLSLQWRDQSVLPRLQQLAESCR